MAELAETVELQAPASQVWAVVGDFGAFADWHPAGTAVTVDKRADATIRTVTIAGGERLTEKLASLDPAAMTLSYTLVDGPLPVESLASSIVVTPRDDQAAVTWRMSFEPREGEAAKAQEMLRGLMEGGLRGLKKRFG